MNFVDLYEVLEISPNANSETIERVFRHLARRFHPDNPATGDRERFDLVVNAHTTLRNAEKRAEYDIEHRNRADPTSRSTDDIFDPFGLNSDAETQTKLLSLFYVKCRKNVREPGIGEAELASILDCPTEYLEFHLWYMKEKKWIVRKEDGLLAITIDGIERASSEEHIKAARKLLTDQT